MKTKILFITTILIFSWTFTFSQASTTVKKGKKYYGLYNYFSAIDKLEPLTDKTVDIKRELAESYYNTGQYEKSEQYYAELVALDNKTADDVYDYVKVLLINQKYQDAEKWMETFKQMAPQDTRAQLYASNKGFYNDLKQDKGYWAIKNLDFNTSDEDFSPVFYKNQVVFSTTRQGIEPIKRKWAWNNLPFLDLYVADIDSGSLEFKSFEQFNFNKKFHEGTVAFNKAGDYMIFTSNNYKKPSSDGVYKLDMFYSVYENNKWQKPKPMPFNSPEYSVGHPTLSDDGNVLFFSSDMPGGIGGVDIYVATKNSDGTWSQPSNLGSGVNTEANEMFPFIHKDGYLFFASNGRPGLGGLDLFIAQKNGTTFSEAQNLGYPVNTNFDDFAMIFNDDLTKGYFSSNRIDGKGNDDIYSFELLTPFFSKKIIEGIAKDDDGNILAEVKVELFDSDGNVINTITTNTDGEFEFTVDADKTFTLTGKKTDYKDDAKVVSTRTPEPKVETELILSRVPNFFFLGLVQDFDSKDPIDDVTIVLKNSTITHTYNLTSDNIGKFTSDIFGAELDATHEYEISVKKDGYIPYNETFSVYYDHEGQYDINDYLKVELHKLNVGDDIAKALNVQPIYFDLSKWNIRPDAAIELDKIVKVMNDYPTLVIELGSHTDSRGSDASNQTLSQKRATSSADYIKQRITNPNRITGKGYGETTNFVVTQEVHDEYNFLPVGQILDNAFIYSLPRTQQQIAHQLNRRTEFKIISF